ncbi:cation:proton antiporter [Fluviicola sp.]|uniref:cation:proton antiporter domain-containing protein n=1 Tax=Fluviicola sp. TaxID=1917219 RepID=UPI0026210D3D|nr:cation:proton antiporter [Fluviicola sp.]
MRNLKNLLFYILTIGGFATLIFGVIASGGALEKGKVTTFKPEVTASTWQQFTETYYHNLTHPLAILLLQIVTIIVVARIFGFFCKKIGQPSVIGEIIAGIFLGPSFIGMYFPEFSHFVFPEKSMDNLKFLSQIGLILFMFVVGMELELKTLRNKANDAVVISHASIIFPFSLGVGLAYLIYSEFAPDNVNFLSFSLFIGISMSITAFPVLARIVQERGLSKTKLGSIVITCAAADDITAWCILAAVIAIVKAGSVLSSIYIIFMAIAYVLIMLKFVQPFLKRLGDKYSNKESLSKPVVAIFFITLLISAFTTEVIGIHALFGAFLAGVIMPSNMNFRTIFIEKIEDVSVLLLLPLFFVFTGLRTQIGLLNDWHLWSIALLIIAVATTGKFLGSALAAKFVGQNWRDSLIIGALMNTRGLMELIVLNIGYDLGVLSDEIFAMLVIMALITTFMTGPLLDLINRFMPEKKTEEQINSTQELSTKYSILLSFGSPERGRTLLRLANSFIRKSPENANITALHVSLSNDLNQFNAEEYERESFAPISEESKELRIPVVTLFKPTVDIDKEITDTSNAGNFDLLLIGIGRSVFEGSLLGRILGFTTKLINPERLYETITGKEPLFENTIFDERTRQLIKNAKLPVGIVIDKNLEKVENVFLPIFSIHDSFLLVYAQKLIHHSNARVVIIDSSGIVKTHPELKESIRMIEQVAPNHISLQTEPRLDKDFMSQQDLMLISHDSWKKAVETQSLWLTNTPSVLILKP